MRVHSLLVHSLDDGHLVFDLETGATHLIDDGAWRVLAQLQRPEVPAQTDGSDTELRSVPPDQQALESLRVARLID